MERISGSAILYVFQFFFYLPSGAFIFEDADEKSYENEPRSVSTHTSRWIESLTFPAQIQ